MFFDFNKDGKENFDDIKFWTIRYGLWVGIFLLLIIFLFILEDVLTEKILNGDVVIYRFISTRLMNNTNTAFLKFITHLGGATFLIGLTILLMIFIKDKGIKLLIPLNLIIIFVLNQAMKFIVQRPRPAEFAIINEAGYSFPSGHSMVSMAYYGFLIWLVYRYMENRGLKTLLILIFTVLIPLVGISRIYLGVHYASDVLAGFCISLVYLILFIKVANRWTLKNEKQKFIR